MKAIRITVASAAVLLALTACSSTGGKPRTTGDGMGSGQADTPRFTVARSTGPSSIRSSTDTTHPSSTAYGTKRLSSGFIVSSIASPT